MYKILWIYHVIYGLLRCLRAPNDYQFFYLFIPTQKLSIQ